MKRLGCRAVDSGQTFTGNRTSSFDHFAGDYELFYAFLRGQGIHCVKEEFLEDHHQAAGANFPLYGLSGDALESIFSELQFNVVEVEFLLVLLNEGIFRLSKDFYESAFIEFVQDTSDGQSTNE